MIDVLLKWRMIGTTLSCMVSMPVSFCAQVYRSAEGYEHVRYSYQSVKTLHGYARNVLFWGDRCVRLSVESGQEAEIVLEGGMPVVARAQGMTVTIECEQEQ